MYSCCRWFCSPSFMRQIHIAIVYVVQTACPKFLVRVLCPVLITYSSCFGVMDRVGDKGHSVSIIVAGWYPNLLVRLCPSIPLVVVTSPFPLPLPKDTCTNLYDWFPHFWFSQFLMVLSSTDKRITVFVCPLPCDNREVSTHNLTNASPSGHSYRGISAVFTNAKSFMVVSVLFRFVWT